MAFWRGNVAKECKTGCKFCVNHVLILILHAMWIPVLNIPPIAKWLLGIFGIQYFDDLLHSSSWNQHAYILWMLVLWENFQDYFSKLQNLVHAKGIWFKGTTRFLWCHSMLSSFLTWPWVAYLCGSCHFTLKYYMYFNCASEC